MNWHLMATSDPRGMEWEVPLSRAPFTSTQIWLMNAGAGNNDAMT